jgi:hypothetical protein
MSISGGAMRNEAHATKQTTGDRASVIRDRRLLPECFPVVSNCLPYQIEVEADRVNLGCGIGGQVTTRARAAPRPAEIVRGPATEAGMGGFPIVRFARCADTRSVGRRSQMRDVVGEGDEPGC